MSWRDNLQQASFRGVPFFVGDVDGSGGRRIVEHTYPGRDKPYHEDMGRAARDFTFNAYVLGPDYMADRNALLRELETPGKGRLIHPWYGERTVVVETFRIRETSRAGGRADFSITFKEGGENLYPAVVADTRLATTDAAALGIADVETAFAESFRVDAKPQFVADAAVANAEQFVTAIEDTIERVVTVAGQLPDVKRSIALMRADLPTLVTTGPSLITRVVNLQASLSGLVKNPIPRIRAMLNLSGWDSVLAPVSTTTASRTRQAANQTAFVSATRQIAVIEAARASAAATFASIDQAHKLRGEIADRLDDEMLVAGSTHQDDLYVRLTDLRSAVVQDITTRSEGLGRLITVTPGATEPDVVIAYRLYADASRASEIANRNDVRHPGFVAGGTPLKVLAHA